MGHDGGWEERAGADTKGATRGPRRMLVVTGMDHAARVRGVHWWGGAFRVGGLSDGE